MSYISQRLDRKGARLLAMRARVVAAVVLVVVGLVWIGQGIGLIGGSFMTGEALWAIIGAVLIVFALALLQGVQRDRRRGAADDV